MASKSKESVNTQEKNNNDNEKKSLLQAIINSINKDIGAQTVSLGDSEKVDIDAIPTGSILVDQATGIGGIPKGRITEIYGSEGSGKTTLCLSIIKECQRQNGLCAFIDVEHALSANYARQLGVDINELIISQPNSGEQALTIVHNLITKNQVDLIVIDSVAALTPESELKGEMNDASMGVKARMLSKGLGKIILEKHNTAIVFINQVRSNIGIMFGNPNVTTGGKALKYYSSLRMEVNRKTLIKKNNETIGQNIQIKVVKNKNANPYTETEIQLLYGKGFLEEDEIIKVALSKNIFEQKGAWYYYNGNQISQGKDSLIAKLQENTQLKQEILCQIDSSQ